MQSDNYNKRLVILLVLILTLQSVHRVVETLTIKVVQCKVPKKERERETKTASQSDNHADSQIYTKTDHKTHFQICS